MMKYVAPAAASLLVVMALTLSSMAAAELVEGSVEKVDAKKGTITLKPSAGRPREFITPTPEKLKDIKVGDKIKLTIQEDGTMVIEKAQ